MSSEQNKPKSTLSKLLFVIAVIIIIILLIFAIIRVVPLALNGLANVGSSIGQLFGSGNNDITVTTDQKELVDEQPFILSWDYEKASDGDFRFSYGCINDVTFDIEIDGELRKLICNTPYKVDGTDNAVRLLVNYGAEDSFTDVPLLINYEDDKKAANGKTFVTITSETSAVAVTETEDEDATPEGELSNANISSEPVETESNTPTNTTGSSNTTNTRPSTVVTSNIPSSFNGPSDLQISNMVTYAGISTIQFTVSNVGGRSTGLWTFNYTTPTNPQEILTSPTQVSLAPGQGIRFTLGFTEQFSASEEVRVTVDPFNNIIEGNEQNNIALVVVTGNGTGSTNNNGSNNGNTNSNVAPDLSVESFEVGRLSGNRFIEDDSHDEGDDIALQIIVKNIGGQESDRWRFTLDDLPFSGNDDSIESNYQPRLSPGETATITIELENVNDGTYNIDLEIDSDNDVREDRETNNDDSVRVRIDKD